MSRVLLGTFGGALLVMGIIMIPYPGPGWLVVFAALALLSREFHWAKRLRDHAKGFYDKWEDWLARQPFAIKSIFWLATATLVIVTIWISNGYGVLHHIFIPSVDADWLYSPFAR